MRISARCLFVGLCVLMSVGACNGSGATSTPTAPSTGVTGTIVNQSSGDMMLAIHQIGNVSGLAPGQEFVLDENNGCQAVAKGATASFSFPYLVSGKRYSLEVHVGACDSTESRVYASSTYDINYASDAVMHVGTWVFDGTSLVRQ